MGADSFVVYIGVRYELSPDEIEAVEARNDYRIIAAREVKLQYYWGHLGATIDRATLLIGSEVGRFGYENSAEADFSIEEVRERSQATQSKLEAAGLGGAVSLHILWEPDF